MGATIALSAVALSCAIYLYIATRESANVRTVADYLPLRRYLNASQYRGTTVAAGMSLATVIIALLNLAPFFGLSLLVTVVTYCLGFFLLSFFLQRIMDRNPENLVIPEYLGRVYESDIVQKVASFFIFIGYMSIFAMELLVGVTILEPLFDDFLIAFAAIYLLFLVAYSWLSGFRGIVATDVWQLRFIVSSIAALIIFLMLEVGSGGGSAFTDRLNIELFTTWGAPLAFCVGIAMINIPAPLSDTGTWQRVCATRNVNAVRKGLFGSILLFGVLWTTIIVLGTLLPAVSFDPTLSSETLMAQVVSTMADAGSGVAMKVLLFVFILGLFSAMVSTADSLLLAATHVVWPWSRTDRQDRPTDQSLKSPRRILVFIAFCSFLLFVAFRVVGLDVVQLVFSIYGAQLAIWPAVFVSLVTKEPKNLRNVKLGAAASIVAGFGAAWASALAGKFFDLANVLFFAPVIGIGSAILVLGAGMFTSRQDR